MPESKTKSTILFYCTLVLTHLYRDTLGLIQGVGGGGGGWGGVGGGWGGVGGGGGGWGGGWGGGGGGWCLLLGKRLTERKPESVSGLCGIGLNPKP